MAITQNVTALNDLGRASLERRDRVTSAGPSARYTVTMESEPILHDWDNLEKAPKVAEAIRALLASKIRGLTAKASTDTVLRRDRYANEFTAGGAAARQRYSGGRIGDMPPSRTSEALFNDSGRFAAGLLVRRNAEERGFTINVAANRLDPKTFGGGEPAIVALWQRLVSLVPEFAGGRAVIQDPTVQRALAEDQADSVFVAGERSAAAARKGYSRLVATVLRDVVRVVQIGA